MSTSELTTSEQEYKALHQLSYNAQLLSSISQLLEWDQEETGMPTDAESIRSEQLKLLAGLTHQERTSSKFAEALERLIDLKSGHILATGLNDDAPATRRPLRSSCGRSIRRACHRFSRWSA